ncbi:hypothetical protein CYMTET_10531 [Cymbomonas tetramitiformis]|uniref:Uncharacterized protein n=1 Tax=Cymbomonas tetramitiformis TaxID=36881 RepID=A0AAE0GP31_9CHLO|nr:hypothetical protein CYMTET_10531 [Cymbomonas tetramitiformis]
MVSHEHAVFDAFRRESVEPVVHSGAQLVEGKKSLGVLEWKGCPDPSSRCRYQGSVSGKLCMGHGVLSFETVEVDLLGSSHVVRECTLEGTFRDNELEGYGVFTGSMAPYPPVPSPEEGDVEWSWANCAKYAGQWRQTRRDGIGVMTCQDGSTYSGVWADDRFLGACGPDTLDALDAHRVPSRHRRETMENLQGLAGFSRVPPRSSSCGPLQGLAAFLLGAQAAGRCRV